MAKQEASVEELVGMIERGELRLPEMQRRYVWRSTRVRDLVDSLYRGYPSGAILLWETDEDVPQQDFAIQQQANAFKTTRLLLDGQQRLTSLAAVIRGKPVTVRGRKRPLELLFNLEHPDELTVVTEVNEDSDDDAEPNGEGIDDTKDDDQDPDEGDSDAAEAEPDSNEDALQKRFDRMAFVVSTRKLESLPHWVKVTEVLKSDHDAPFLERAGIVSLKDPKFTKYSQRLARLRAIKKYEYRMDVLERALPYDEVTEIFVRVNSLGAKLRSSDLALAQITAKWKKSLAVFQEYQAACTKQGYELDLGLFLKNMVAVETSQSRFLTVGRLPLNRLQTGWKNGCLGMDYALNFIRTNAGIDSPALLSSPFILIALAYFGHKRDYQVDTKEAERLRFWVMVANAKGRFSRGSSETVLDQDLALIRDGGTADTLVERLRQQAGRLDVTPEELEGRNQRSALFKTMFLAFRAGGAKDWRSNVSISLSHSGAQHRLQYHHIFPKAVLKGAYSSREADDIANLAFIGGKTNQKISAKKPGDYLPPLIEKNGPEQFESQCIPTDSQHLTIDAYKGFLALRRALIAKRLNAFLGTASDSASV